MSFSRIKGLLLQEFFITLHSLEIAIDLLFFSLVTTFTFGLFSLYSSAFNSETAHFLYMGILLMEIVRITQYTTSLNALWNIWSRNLANIFISPISLKEYFTAQMLSGSIKAGLIFTMISLIAKFVFKFDVFAVGPINLILFYINLVIFSWWFGISVLGFIFRAGSRFAAFAWSLVFVLEPVMAVFFPVKILPPAAQFVSFLLPPTYVFEAARQALINPAVNWEYASKAFILNILYFALAIWFFNYMFRKSKESGQFARNEG